MICKLKLHSQGFSWKNLRALHVPEDLEPLFKIFYTFVNKKVPGKLQTNIWKIQRKPLEKFKHRYAPQFFWDNPLLCSFSLQLIFCSEQLFYGNYWTLDSHTNTVVSWCVCLLVKMASKTVTRSISRLNEIECRTTNWVKNENKRL